MTQTIDIKIPDLGDFEDVPVIDIFSQAGDEVEKEQPLLALESDKATMEIPSPAAGKIEQLTLTVGEHVKSGQIIGQMTVSEASTTEEHSDTNNRAAENNDSTAASAPAATVSSSSATAPATTTAGKKLVVIGSGPGGYTAAFRAADLGMEVTLIERYASLGGVCLNVGCIPSKALLHVAKVINESKESSEVGLHFTAPRIDLEQVNDWKNSVVNKLTGGLAGLAKQRKVTVKTGNAQFIDANQLEISGENGSETLSFDQAIIAVGSQPVQIPSFPHDDPRIIDSTGALDIRTIPDSMLVIGGGIIGLEMATVYHSMGTRISVVEMLPSLMTGADSDLVKPFMKRIEKHYDHIWLNTQVTKMTPRDDGILVEFEGKDAQKEALFDKVLVAVGRTPNGDKINAQAAGVNVTQRGFIEADDQQRTNVAHIYAIGDVVGQPMLAHKAVHEGKVAAEVAAGHKSGFDARVIPSVAYTDPEVAWVGLTEIQAKEKGIDYGKGVFPWAASGRALSQERAEGMTKLIFDKATDRLLGAGIVGINAGDLINEAALAIEMGADAQDIGLTIHAHPTLSETIGFAAEAFEGTITDLYMPKKN